MVATDEKPAPHPFDVPTVQHLIGLMSTHELTEIELTEGDQRIRLRRGAKLVAAAPLMAPAPSPVSLPAPAPAPPPPPALASKKYLLIKSPLIGTFYAKPDPKLPDYVKVGSSVKPDSVVCKVEAMKIFNDITADVTGVIAEVCVQNGQPVEFDTVLFKVEAG